MVDSTSVVLRPATRDDCFETGHNLRRDDYLELRYLHGSEADNGWTLDSQRMSRPEDCHALWIGGDLIGIGGCPETRPGIAVPWFMGTPNVKKYRFSFHYLAKKLVEYWSERYDILSNVVWDGSSAKPWLERLGFKMSPDIAFVTKSGGEFRRFLLIGEKNVPVRQQHSSSGRRSRRRRWIASDGTFRSPSDCGFDRKRDGAEPGG